MKRVRWTNGRGASRKWPSPQPPRRRVVSIPRYELPVAAGVSAEEIRHAILLTLTTIGFPRAMAALSWAEDVLRRRAR